MDAKYDHSLMGILQQEGQLGSFLDVIMGFLYRRTDFYHLLRDKNDTKGFPPGMALNILLKSYRQFEDMAKKDPEKMMIQSDADIKKQECEEKRTSKAESPKKASSKTNITVGQKSEANSQQTKQHKTSSELSTSEKEKKTEESSCKNDSNVPSNYQADSECYNGAERDTYSWSQSITDCDLRVKVPKDLVKGKQVKVVFNKKHLKISYKDDNGEENTLVDDDLMWEIHKEECMWSLIPGEHVHISLEKVQERWWEAVFVNEPKINVREIDCSRPMSDLKEDEQMKLHELMHNERQKRLGLPQSHEEKAHDMLKQAWHAEGSPFKGQEFDPSKFKIDPSGVLTMNQ
ncbi:nudC domain-containing protein 3 isoform X1 [Octopus bimaculoides]|uniref:CS domain-containing protein n=1 Tax=Octopus bimaculoides TaxID=37653 RepID=A0A0L8FHW4_OCTBM|nr:nudC domain-containing protein 3 isoform X1 [Octopus bimaculoides]|eukprot:XP_014789674.1 PREDICTED: nudC domain-containing protein 3-like isoform X1 [Octopus bimaculoides]